MRAQNEPPETVVRLVRGEPAGEPTDVPGAYRVERVDEHALAEGRIWPQSRGSQLAGLVVGAREGERVLDSCAAPGGKATMLAGEVTAVEVNPGARASCATTCAASARRTSRSSRPTRSTCRRSSTASTARSSTRRARARRPRARPDLRWRAPPLPELQLALLREAAARVEARRHGRLLGLHDQRGRERGRRRRLRARGRRRSAASGRSTPTRSGPSSC